MKLAHKSAIGTMLIVAMSILGVLLPASDLVFRSIERAIASGLSHKVDAEISAMQARLEAVRADAATLAEGPVIAQFLAAGGTPAARGALESRLVALMRRHPAYFQARYIDATGREVARVDQNGPVPVPVPVVVAVPDLQDKSGRDYVDAMLGLAPGETYLSEIGLNREHGRIERPLRPALRVAAPVFDDAGQRRGGVVINLRVAAVLPPVRRGSVEFRIADAAGQYLLHPDPDWEFGTELGTGNDFVREFARPPPAAGHLSVGDVSTGRGDPGRKGSWRAGSGRTDSGGRASGRDGSGRAELVSQQPGGHGYLAAWRWFAAGAGAPRWLFLATEPTDIAFAPLRSTLIELIGFGAVMAVLGCVAGWLKARRITRQVTSVARIAKRIAAGEHDVVADVSGSDEVSEMSAAFNTMTARLRGLLEREAESNRLLTAANTELQRSNAELASFAQAAAHDLKTPLRAIAAMLDWIDEDFDDVPDDLRRHVAQIQAQVRRLQALTDGLLQYSVLGGNGSQLEEIPPGPAIDALLAALALPKGFEVEVRVGSPRITVVPTEFEIILRNLIGNAVSHHDRDHGRIAVTVAEDGETLVIEVADDGPGIPPEEHEKILRPLYKGADSGGSGLGLAFIAKIADRWSGTVSVRSAPPDRGTTFRVELPREPKRQVQPGQLRAVEGEMKVA